MEIGVFLNIQQGVREKKSEVCKNDGLPGYVVNAIGGGPKSLVSNFLNHDQCVLLVYKV